MENKNLPILNTSQELTTTSKISDLGLIIKAERDSKIFEASNKDIIGSVRYIMALLGIAKERMPSSPEMVLIISYLRTHMRDYTVSELKLAFDLAIQKRFVTNLELFGGTLSVKFISEVLIEYFKYKKETKFKSIKKDQGLNNVQRLDAITPLLSKETRDLIDQIGKPSPKPKAEFHKHPFYDLHQKWFRQFDELHKKYANKLPSAVRLINRYGQVMDVEAYFNKKVEQLQLAKNRNSENL